MSTPVDPNLREKIRTGLYPQQDFFALAEALNADLLTPLKPSLSKTPKLLRLFSCAWAAFQQRHRYDLIISDVERVGIILAALLKLAGAKTRHIMVCHGKVVHFPYLRIIQAFKLQTHIHRFVCYGPAVARELKEALDLPDDRVLTVRHSVDHRFWHPLPVAPEPLILSAGMLRRDYPTIIEAVRGLDVSLVIAASSPWVYHQKKGINAKTLPPNVRITRCNYKELCELYARSLFVAIPLVRSQAQSGSLVVYEAMAMGKAVVISRTEGQDALDTVKEGETGYYVAPGDVQGWRRTITHLLDHTQATLRMGQRARELVESGLNMDVYVQEMANIAHSVIAENRGTAI